jgi:hypothetical protein
LKTREKISPLPANREEITVKIRESGAANMYVEIFRINIFWIDPDTHFLSHSLQTRAPLSLDFRDASSGTQFRTFRFDFPPSMSLVSSNALLARTQSLFIIFLLIFNDFSPKFLRIFT